MVREFRRLNLVELSYREYDGRQVIGIKLHDGAHDFCSLQSRLNESIETWHWRMLAGYAFVQSKNGEESGGRRISQMTYVPQNVARHLIGCKELKELPLDFRCTLRQLEVNDY